MASVLRSTRVQPRMLSKEDEARTEEVEVRREDQDMINKFSRLHQKETLLEEELNLKLKEKEELEDVSNELELADEDDIIPYKIGDCFLSLPLPEVQELLEASTTRVTDDVNRLEEKMGCIRSEMSELKVHLYARFGPSINLET
ncbi:prefoldin subunit 4 [Erysiphe pulchra]|uniref:Prefoldin subunit 4 n=1 Tax=Erysiphe pulchra TaxID=225359 RepID=A0A2S4PUA7_9PEZI|nr:prefoldin subunit 4 [Erysiphe pulchra]